MTGADLVSVCPVLFHMAHDGSWPSIDAKGLLSTTALLDLFKLEGPERETIEAAHRAESVRITHPELGEAVIRDQKPMSDSGLLRCLEGGMTPADWYRELNGRVFFWATYDRLMTMLQAGAYRTSPQTVLTVDTRALVARHNHQIQVAVMNTGNTRPFPHPRGPETFVSLSEFDYKKSRRKRGRSKAIAEIVLPHAVPDIRSMVIRVERYVGGRPTETLFEA